MSTHEFRLRTSAAVALGKLSGAASRRLGRGGGSALPGLLAQRLDKTIVGALAAQIPQGSVLITGTNGKTTTSRMLATILEQAQLATLHNRSGSNLMRGLATTLVGQASLTGALEVASNTLGLFEVDEFVLPQAVQEVEPRAVVMTNLFRDQLDRYGEVDLIAARWKESMERLGANSVAVLNGDDPTVAALGQGRSAGVIYYGVDDERHALASLEHAADSKWCPYCNVNYRYTLSFYGHIGHYACPSCSWRRPTPHVRAVRVELRGFAGTDIDMVTPAGALSVRLAVPGLYNVYNALAATSAALALGIPLAVIRAGLERATAAFGRMERLEIDGKSVYLLLAKNPTGLNQVIRALRTEPGPKNLIFMLNDNIADGRDVSWIWDVDFEQLAGQVRTLVCSGIRAEDVALRLKLAEVYGGAPDPRLPVVAPRMGDHRLGDRTVGDRGLGDRRSPLQGDREDVGATRGRPEAYPQSGQPSFSSQASTAETSGVKGVVERDLGRALEQGLANTEPGGTLYIVPTYTAMLDLRRELVRRGYVRHFLESK